MSICGVCACFVLFCFVFCFVFLTLLLSSFWTSRGHRCRPSPPRFLPSIFIAHRVQQSHCSSIFHRVLVTHALALSASQFVHKKKSQRIYTSMHSAGLEPTKLTYTRLEDNLIRHRGDRLYIYSVVLHARAYLTFGEMVNGRAALAGCRVTFGIIRATTQWEHGDE